MESDGSFLISVIVPVYNAEKYLDRCISSITNQSYKNLEIILINDGSTDNSLPICNYWRQKDRRIKVFEQQNGGAAAARNVGLRNMTGQYVGFVDADDEIKPSMYEVLLSQMLRTDAELGVCTDVILDENRHIISKSTVKSKILCNEQIIMDFLKIRIPGGVCNKLFLSSIIQSRNLEFDEDIIHNEDFLFFARYCLKASKCILVNKPFYLYYSHHDSVTHVKNEKFDKKKLTSIVAARRLLDDLNSGNRTLLKEGEHFYLLKVADVLIELAQYPEEQKWIDTQKSLQAELRKGLDLLLADKQSSFIYKVLIVLAAYHFKVLKVFVQLKTRR
ncbi:MAG: glycosyltransferase [Clostridiales bacterium]|nr:glycosyltransferase [Clostridiales bacterium]